jgi:hypothetical protein
MAIRHVVPRAAACTRTPRLPNLLPEGYVFVNAISPFFSRTCTVSPGP